MSNNRIRVATTSAPHLVAGSIAKTLRTGSQVEIQAIGAGAVNQMIKAVILARSYVRPDGMQPCCVPSFVEVDVEGRRCTAIHLLVQAGPSEEEESADQDEGEN